MANNKDEYIGAVNQYIDNIESAETTANITLSETDDGQTRCANLLRAFVDFQDQLTRAAFHYTTSVVPRTEASTEKINGLAHGFAGLFNDRVEGNEHLEAARSGLSHCVDRVALGGAALHTLGVSYPEIQATAAQLYKDLRAHYVQMTALKGAMIEQTETLPSVHSNVVDYRDTL